eukprot:1431891-Pyramimonas_sp.AAC.1
MLFSAFPFFLSLLLTLEADLVDSCFQPCFCQLPLSRCRVAFANCCSAGTVARGAAGGGLLLGSRA